MPEISRKEKVKSHYDSIAQSYDQWKSKNSYYYQNIKSFVKSNVSPHKKVLEIGCGAGEILAATKPARGVGIDISAKMVAIASEKYPEFDFYESAVEDFRSDEKFDYIILVDIIDHVYDIMDVFDRIYKLCHPSTKIILTTINPWWDPVFKLAEKFEAKMPEGFHNFIEKRNIAKILELTNFSVSLSGYLLLFPKYIPVLSFLANTIGVRMWGINKLSVVPYMMLQPTPVNTTDLGFGCSVIIPCHNEEGSIQEAIKRVPHMGKGTEIIVVNDGSTDATADKVRELESEYPNLKLIDYSPNKGKGHAVQAGFDAATQEVLMILDADLSVIPEELPRFFEPLNKGLCRFTNGTRLVYPMESQAMRFLNNLGNKLFGLVMSFIMQQHLTDTLCGTKAFLKKDYKYFKMGKDSWGDFDLLFGAAKMGLKILEVPVHYKDRFAGESKMNTLRHGTHLLGAVYKGFKELVFISDEKS